MAAIALLSAAHKNGQCQWTRRPQNLYIQGFERIVEDQVEAVDHFDYRWKAENLIRSSPYSWVVTSHKKYINYFFKVIPLTIYFLSLTLAIERS